MNIELDPRDRTIRAAFKKQENCRFCLGEHDDDVHEATLRVRAWFREQVTRYLDLDTDVEIEFQEPSVA